MILKNIIHVEILELVVFISSLVCLNMIRKNIIHRINCQYTRKKMYIYGILQQQNPYSGDFGRQSPPAKCFPLFRHLTKHS